jgi:hypothetical protein
MEVFINYQIPQKRVAKIVVDLPEEALKSFPRNRTHSKKFNRNSIYLSFQKTIRGIESHFYR